MECFPVEVIGNILSRLERLRDVIVASTTCRKWREAYRNHLSTLSFHGYKQFGYSNRASLETLITSTISQTTGLQDLTISQRFREHMFSASTAIACLEYTKNTLRRLLYAINTEPDVNVLDYFCGSRKLEEINIAWNKIVMPQPDVESFPCLRLIALYHVKVSTLDLTLLFAACPRLDSFKLLDPTIKISDAHAGVELNSPTLKTFFAREVKLTKFILKADGIQYLNFEQCTFDIFELVSEGGLKHLKIHEVDVEHFDITDTCDNLETLEVSNCSVVWPKIYEMIPKSSKLRKLLLWFICVEGKANEKIDFGNIVAWCPQLNRLSLSYDIECSEQEHGKLQYNFKGAPILENVVNLEVRWDDLDKGFWKWVEELLVCCPNVTKLIIHGNEDERGKFRGKYGILSDYNSSMVEFVRKYKCLELQFDDEETYYYSDMYEQGLKPFIG